MASAQVGLRVSLAFGLIALLIVAIAENSRIPVDNPATHLELTMVHEAMILEASGRHLALWEYAAQMRLLLWFALAAPHGLVLLAAVVALLGHCATAYVAGAPSDAQVEPALLRRWAGRVLVVVAVTTAVWALAQLLSAANLPGSVALTTAALVGLGGWALLVRGGDASDR